MEQTTHLKQTVEKLDRAVARLQDIQSALRGHCPLPSDPNPEKEPQLSIFNGLGDNYLAELGSQRRWSMPAPLMHDHVLSDAVAVSKFAKKTVDMVKVQKKKQAARSVTISSYCSLQADQTSILRPSNRINLPQPVDMSTTNNASKRPKDFGRENRTSHESNLEFKDDPKIYSLGSARRDTSMRKPRSASNRAHSTRIGSDEDVRSSIIKLRALKHLDEAAADTFASRDDGIDCNMQDQHAAIKRSSLSMRTLMRIEDEEEKDCKPASPRKGDDEDLDSLSSVMPSKCFSVQLEENKPSKKKPWSFTHPGKVSDNVVVMFPNPTFDETTPTTNTPPEYDQKAIDASITKQSSIHEKARMLPSTTMKNEAFSSNRKASFPKKEKIVRLSPCVTSTGMAPKPQLRQAPAMADASTSKRTSSAKKQNWLCTLTHPPSPTLIRRLPEAHEMKEIKQTTQNYVEEEDQHYIPKDYADDAPDSLGRSWSFDNSSRPQTSSDARRSSHNSAGGQAFSFLSRHFHAWKLASKHNK